jgi:catechol O-methyltransferase
MMNVGDEKGAILDRADRARAPRRLLELGTYCGYSALRTARAMPAGAHLSRSSSAPPTRRSRARSGTRGRRRPRDGRGRHARRRRRHDRAARAEHGFAPGSLDFVFVDHDKAAYLPDLERILARGWLHPGRWCRRQREVPGAPKYRAYMQAHEGRSWRTIEHDTHVEYQTLIKDLVLESEYLG